MDTTKNIVGLVGSYCKADILILQLMRSFPLHAIMGRRQRKFSSWINISSFAPIAEAVCKSRDRSAVNASSKMT